MVHGTPDWGRTNAPATIFQMNDLGELAVRLGSIVTHDRRGDVLWLDDFEATLNKWDESTIGTGAAIAIDTLWARNGAQSLHLTGGSDSLRRAFVAHTNPLTGLSNIGMELAVMFDGDFDNFTLDFSVFDGTDRLRGRLRYQDDTNILEYIDSSNNPVTLESSFVLAHFDSEFHVLKLVIDAVGRNYVRAIVDQTEYDLSGVNLHVSTSAGSPRIVASVEMISRSIFNDDCWVDDVILTQNEP